MHKNSTDNNLDTGKWMTYFHIKFMIANHSKDIVDLVSVSYWLIKLEAHVVRSVLHGLVSPKKNIVSPWWWHSILGVHIKQAILFLKLVWKHILGTPCDDELKLRALLFTHDNCTMLNVDCHFL